MTEIECQTARRDRVHEASRLLYVARRDAKQRSVQVGDVVHDQNGTRIGRVTWTGRTKRGTGYRYRVAFDHGGHTFYPSFHPLYPTEGDVR